MKSIKTFYVKNGIDFFLFGPGLTLMTKTDMELDTKFIYFGGQIQYQNKAKVNTAFVTNLGTHRIETAPDLCQLVREAQQEAPPKPRRIYPDNLVTCAMLSNVAPYKHIAIDGPIALTNSVGNMKELGIDGLYGMGFLLKNEEAKKWAAIKHAGRAERAAYADSPKCTIKIELTDEEKVWCASPHLDGGVPTVSELMFEPTTQALGEA